MSDPNGVPGGMTACSSALTVNADIAFGALGTGEVALWPPPHPSKGRVSARATPRLERDGRMNEAVNVNSRCDRRVKAARAMSYVRDAGSLSLPSRLGKVLGGHKPGRELVLTRSYDARRAIMLLGGFTVIHDGSQTLAIGQAQTDGDTGAHFTDSHKG